MVAPATGPISGMGIAIAAPTAAAVAVSFAKLDDAISFDMSLETSFTVLIKDSVASFTSC